MNYSDQFRDTPENREHMKAVAEACAWAQGVVYIVVKAKSSGQLGVEPKRRFDPERDDILFEVSGGGRRAAEERWRKLREMEDSL
jgi:hypothetical protein